jgi:hypothetical protein
MAKRTISLEVELPDNIDQAILNEIASVIGAECWILSREWTDPDNALYQRNWNQFRALTGMNLQVSPKELTIKVVNDKGEGCGQ